MTALQATAGANLTWLRDKVVEYDDPLLSAGHVSRDEGTIFDAFDKIIPTVPAGANGVLYTPWLYGERAPVDDPNLRAGFFNISLDTNRSDLLRAVFEGVALNTRWLARAVDRFLGAPVTSMVITGGGARSDSWCQIFADVLGIEIRRDAQPVAVNARGAGWIGAVGAGMISFADIPGADAQRPGLRARRPPTGRPTTRCSTSTRTCTSDWPRSTGASNPALEPGWGRSHPR